MSLCDRCYAPGACCKTLKLYSGGEELRFYINKPLNEQFSAPLPFKTTYYEHMAEDDSGEPYGYMTFECTKLLEGGRCGIYEDRPTLCREYEPRQDLQCHCSRARDHVYLEGRMTTTIARYIPRHLAAQYEAEGWRVCEMVGHHAFYSLIATKEDVTCTSQSLNEQPDGLHSSPPRNSVEQS